MLKYEIGEKGEQEVKPLPRNHMAWQKRIKME